MHRLVALALLVATAALVPACAGTPSGEASDGSRMIPIETPAGTFRVWTRRVGDNPRVKVLVLHGGPGLTHEYLEAFDEHLPATGIEYIHYDQLGAGRSDAPDAPELWTVPRFVDEVEQVRVALGLDADDLVLYGHSWGGILALEYALAHPGHLKGLVISDMMCSVPAYNAYARDVLMPQMDPAALAEIQAMEAEGRTDDPRYMELLMPQHYERHILLRPADQWPDGVMRSLEHMNPQIYVRMQGPSELGMSGTLEHWDRCADLPRIDVPTLVIGAAHDTMDPAHMAWMATQFPQGRFLLCPDGSHLAMYDDAQVYWDGLIAFLRELERADAPRAP